MDPLDAVSLTRRAYRAARQYVALTGSPTEWPKFSAYQDFRRACSTAQLDHWRVLREVRAETAWGR